MKPKLGLGLCFIIIAWLVMLSGCGSGDSTPPSDILPDIAFVSNSGYSFLSPYSRIWSMRPDGSATQLTDATDKHEIYPTFSNDRTKLAFISDRDGAYAIYIANADGTSPQKLDIPAFDIERIALSPDGTKLAYSNNRIRVKTIGSADPPLKLTTASTFTDWDKLPSWSPDGLKIAFSSRISATYKEKIYIVNSDGTTTNPYSSPLMATTPPGARDESPSWSPDGTQIAFSSLGRPEVPVDWKIYISVH